MSHLKKKKLYRLFLFLWWWSRGKMAAPHLSFLVTYLSHLSPLFTYELWPRKMERRKLCSVGHLEDPVWNWNEHESLSLLYLQKRPSDSFCPPVSQKKITEAPVLDLNVHFCVTDRRSFLHSQQNKTISIWRPDLSKHQNNPYYRFSQWTTSQQLLPILMHWWNIVIATLFSQCGIYLFIFCFFVQGISKQQQHWFISPAADHSDTLISLFFIHQRF